MYTRSCSSGRGSDSVIKQRRSFQGEHRISSDAQRKVGQCDRFVRRSFRCLEQKGTGIMGNIYWVVLKQNGSQYKHRIMVDTQRGVCSCDKPKCSAIWWLGNGEREKASVSCTGF